MLPGCSESLLGLLGDCCELFYANANEWWCNVMLHAVRGHVLKRRPLA